METAVLISPEEYLAQERLATYKSEYFEGEVIAMAGASTNHNRISYNIVGFLWSALRNTDFVAFHSDMKVRNTVTDSFLYPDVVIFNEEKAEFFDEERDILLNPLVIIEILSRSTAEYDRHNKFEAYKRLETLQEYILVAQDRSHVEVCSRTGETTWLSADFFALSSNLVIATIGVTMPLSNIYERVKL
jgi:Uma2 family endonuclease